MYQAYKFRIYPDKRQTEQLMRTFGCVRFVYNYYLALQEEHHMLGIPFMNRTAMNNHCNRELKNMYPWLREIDKFAVTNSVYNLADGYDRFFKKAGGHPKFKSRRKSKFSYTTNFTNNNIGVTEKAVKLPKCGMVKASVHRRIPDGYILKSAAISMERDGTFYCSLLYEYETDVQPTEVKTHVGLDYKSDGLYAASDGTKADMPHYYRRAEKRLARAQKALSRTMGSRRGEKVSNNHKKKQRKVAKLSRHTANQRKDFLHKLSNEITNRYDLISVESLDMRAISRGLRLGKATLDNGYGMFINMLEYKQQRKGHSLIHVDKTFPSSQLCRCGYKNPVTKNLAVRKITCPVCGAVYDRDENASANIDKEGLRLYQAG